MPVRSLLGSLDMTGLETRPIVDASSPHGLVNGLVLTVDPGTKDQGTQGPEN